MRIPCTFLALPPSLLLLLATQLLAQADPQSRNDDTVTLPTAVRKMSLDEGEKFMPEYYAFGPSGSFGGTPQSPFHFLARNTETFVLTSEEEALLAANSSVALMFRPPFPRHYDYRALGPKVRNRGDLDSKGLMREEGQVRRLEEVGASVYRRAREVLARLQGREFICPGGTHACTNINQPNYCCTDGTTCFVVENAPDAGNVGCCPDGQTCGGSVGSCAEGSTACPADEGGGCCIAGFVCAQVGCVASTVSVITQTTTIETHVSWPTPATSFVTTTVIETITPSPSPQPTTSTRTVTQTTTPSTSDASSSTNSGTGTGSGLPPVRPTSSSPNSDPTGGGSTTTTTGTGGDYCPTGFYACVASAGSGCCRTGRDCSTTSCPPVPSTTIINTNGLTVVVPVTDADAASAAATATATCAGGWFQCGADAGPVPGCCPSGYTCGTASCTLSAATATATVQKELPGNGAGRTGITKEIWGALLACLVLQGAFMLQGIFW
ncbi:hypothetical protein F5Y19DRAFT_242620 [Xylariaceae sp. FL1651]|nr:hypothetical protein F5Y19DRAFT_242620 [Xylariaceae sp. FL1651]